jgi:hypothetical protein
LKDSLTRNRPTGSEFRSPTRSNALRGRERLNQMLFDCCRFEFDRMVDGDVAAICSAQTAQSLGASKVLGKPLRPTNSLVP